MKETIIRKPAHLLCEKCGQSVYPMTGVCPACEHVNSRLPASFVSVENQLVRDRGLNPHVARGLMEDQAELVGKAIAEAWHPVEAADAVWRAVRERFYRVRIDGEEYHGLPAQVVEQMRDKSVLHKDTRVEWYVQTLVENLALNGVKLTLERTAPLEDKCRLILDASIVAGLTERIEP